MYSQVALVASAFTAIGAEAYYQQSYRPSYDSYQQQSYHPQQSYRPAPQQQQYQYRQPYYQAYSYPHYGGNAVPQGWYSATQQFRPIAIPYVAWKGSETIYAACRNSSPAPADTNIEMSQVPGQPITVNFTSLDATDAAAAAIGNTVNFSLRKYGCNANGAFDVTGINNTNNPEFNPIEEKLPDGTGVASFQDPTRGRLNSLISLAADEVYIRGPYTTIAPKNTQSDFLQNLVGADGIIGRCVLYNAPIVEGGADPLPAGTFTATTVKACQIERVPAPTNFANPQYTPHHHHFVPQTYNRYPAFPRYQGYSSGGVY